MRPLLPISMRLLLLLGLAGAGEGRAQAPPLQWERLGSGMSEVDQDRVDGIAFRRGASADGSLDTLYAVSNSGVFRFSPGASEWELLCTVCGAEVLTATKEGYLLIGSRAGPISGGARSTDGGRTWEHDVVGHGIVVLFQSTLPALGGAVYACGSFSCSRSFEGGAAGSWLAGDGMGGQPAALAEAAPSERLPEGRLLGGAWNGAVFSDDGGRTWAPSSLWGPGRFAVGSLTFAPDPAHPYGGVAFAGVRDFGLGRPAVYRSEDAGQTWEQVLAVNPGEYGLPSPDWIEVRASPEPGGAVFAGVEDIPGGTTPSSGPVLASFDGGQTWKVVADSTNGWGGFGVNVFEVGRDGRLYVGTDRGVWRTVAPLPVGSGGEAPEKTGVRLEAYPNPSDDSVTVSLALEAVSSVTVAVYDVLGRQVAALHSGELAAGSHELGFDGRALAPGLYVVRATGGGVVLSRRVTVLR